METMKHNVMGYEDISCHGLVIKSLMKSQLFFIVLYGIKYYWTEAAGDNIIANDLKVRNRLDNKMFGIAYQYHLQYSSRNHQQYSPGRIIFRIPQEYNIPLIQYGSISSWVGIISNSIL